jgi:stage III sporulation protein SpoIIIAA
LQTPPTDLDALLAVLPEKALLKLCIGPKAWLDGLAELVFDFGRKPHILYMLSGAGTLKRVDLDCDPMTKDDLAGIADKVKEFSAIDNRGGIENTLHRVSRKLNSADKVIGLTIRVGRTAGNLHNLLKNELDKGSSILFVGKPGSGKTTLIRDCAKYLAETKRVEIVDTSGEIAGDGDIPHPAVGKARRMMVRDRRQQHRILLEATQNHTPEVLVIDEIGHLDEVAAARDVSQRGVQLLASAHGSRMSDILSSPVLVKLLGDVHVVIQSHSEIRMRQGKNAGNVHKTVRERMGNPAFDIVVEIQRPCSIIVVDDIDTAIDNSLEKLPFKGEARVLREDGTVAVFNGEIVSDRSR